jgi:hypothetical protein
VKPGDPPRARGRPKTEEPAGTSVTTWLRISEYDRLMALAKREEQTLSALVRELLKRKIG